MKIRFLLLLSVLLVSCTGTGEMNYPIDNEYIIACGKATGSNTCHEEANKLCTVGYATLSESRGFREKEIRISCLQER